MKRSEFVSRILLTIAVLGAVGAPLYFWGRTPIVHARMPDNGGWSPDVIRGTVDEPLHLRLTSDDVVHGFAVGQLDMQSVDILPGKVTEVTLVFGRPGVYTYYCTRWCGLNHWRMRGTIEINGSPSDPSTSSGQPPEPASAPLYVTLGLDLDAPHDAPAVPAYRPSARDGQEWAAILPVDLSVDYFRSHSPYQVFSDLSGTPLTDLQRWDVVAYVWRSHATPESLATGRELYAQNCAACHGEQGAGDGVFADDLQSAGASSMQSMSGSMDMSMQTPVDFTDPKRTLGASPAVLHGKILRGGMGTGMPMWGSILTESQIWDLTAYLYSFQFEYEAVP